MKSIIICEGKTDADFLQYYMRKVHNWEDDREPEESDFRLSGRNFARILKKGADALTLTSSGGCSRIIPAIGEVIEYNTLQRTSEAFDKIVFVTDNDEENSVENVMKGLKEVICANSMVLNSDISNSTWINVSYSNRAGENGTIKILPVIIPFGERKVSL